MNEKKNSNQQKKTPEVHSQSIISHIANFVKSTPVKIIFLLLWTIISIYASQFIFSIIFGILFRNSLSSPLTIAAYSALCYSFSLFLLIFIPWKLFKKGLPKREDLGLKNLPTFIDLGLAPAGFVAYYLLAGLLTSLFNLFPWFNILEEQDVGYGFLSSAPDKIIAFIALVVIAPIAEELIFRGWLYGKLRAKLPKKISLPVSIFLVSLLFAILHGQWNVGVNVFAMSIILCLLRETTGTVYAGILLHIIKNALAFYLVYIMI